MTTSSSPSPTALEVFKERHASQSTVLIFYRGERSFFCKLWLRRWLTIPVLQRRLDLSDATLLFVSSQSQGKAFCVADQLSVPPALLDKRIFFFGDPEHLLVSYLVDHGLPRPVITNPDTHRAHGWVFDFGMVQPAVVAFAPGLNLLYAWTSKPSLLNVAGKLDRPDPLDVWDCIEHRLDRIRISKAREERKKAVLAESSSSSAARTLALPAPYGDGSKEYIARDPFAGISGLIPSINSSSEERKYGAVGTEQKEMQSETAIGVVKRNRKISTVSTGERRISTGSKERQLSISSLKERESLIVRERQTSLVSDGEPLSTHDTGIAPPSTNIESLTDAYPRAKEEPDHSDGDIASTAVRDNVSSNINALASEVLRDNTLAVTPMPLVSQRIAELENKSAQAALDDFATALADLEAKENAQRKVDFASMVTSRKTSPTIIHDDTPVNTDISEDEDESSLQEEELLGYNSNFENCGAGVERVSTNRNGAIANIIDAGASSSSRMSSREANRDEEDFIGSTKSTRESRSLEQTLTLATLSEVDEVVSPDRREPSFGSTGSGQADASLAANKFSSIRTDDSAHVNTCEPEKKGQILEEADDTKTGVADYLRELKDPERQSYVVRGSRLLQVSSRGVVVTPVGSVTGEETEEMAILSEMENEKMDSPHPEPTVTRARIIDVSPFADAEYSFNANGTKSSLRDEYEAYDEYVVCEFEVEEFVEELESEDSTKSKVVGPAEEGEVEEEQRVGGVRRVLRMVVGVRGRKSLRDEGERVGRKETLRRVFGKREEEEEAERLGRKETLKSVLRKIPRKKKEDDVHRLPSLGCTGGGEKKKIFTRTLSRLRASGVEEEEWEGGERGEKVGEKRSLVGVGGRIFGKLRMS